jgi:hypothetical protein
MVIGFDEEEFLILNSQFLIVGRARSSSGRAVDLHSTGKGFESPRVHSLLLKGSK